MMNHRLATPEEINLIAQALVEHKNQALAMHQLAKKECKSIEDFQEKIKEEIEEYRGI